MATTIAAINGTGQVIAVNAQGVQRSVKVGDVLQKGEILRTPAGTAVELLMDDGKPMQVSANQAVRLDEHVTQSDQRPTAQDSAVTSPAGTAETVIQALARGTDLSTELEATAAGLGGGGAGADGGNTFVQLLRITEGVDPLSYQFAFQALPAADVPVVASAIPAETIAAAITINPIAGDNVINVAEAAIPVTTITGTVGADVKLGDTVTLTVNGNSYTAEVVQGESGLVFSVPVNTADLVADQSIDVSVTTSNAAGTVTATATAGIVLGQDVTPPQALITIDPVTGDNLLNSAETTAITTDITGTVGGDVKAGDVVTLLVNGTTYTGAVTLVDGKLVYDIPVATADLLADKTIDASVTVIDSAGNSTTATAADTVGLVNLAPDTAPSSGSGAEDSEGITVSLSGSDADGSVASFTISSLPLNGTLYLNGVALAVGDSVPATGNGAAVIFVPAANWNGDTSFTYAALDNDGLPDATPATANITVTPVNDPPVFVDPFHPENTVASYSFSYAENSQDATVLGTVKATDVDAGATITYSITGGDTNNYYEINSSTGAISLTPAGVAALTNDYEALANTRDIVVTAADGQGATTDITVSLTETNVNEALTFTNPNVPAGEGTPASY
ncbi:MAG: hypothetical protein RLZZ371_1873, partial [Pseudomonadota bacterium]